MDASMRSFSRLEKAAVLGIAIVGLAAVVGAGAFLGGAPPDGPGPEPWPESQADGNGGPRSPNGNSEGVTPPVVSDGPKGIIRGAVVDEAKNPIADAVVELFAAAGRARLITIRLTDLEGTFNMSGVPAGQACFLMAKAAGYAPSNSTRVEVRANRISNFTITMRRGAGARFRVIDSSTDRPIEGAVLWFARQVGSAPSVYAAIGKRISDANGTAVMTLEPGIYEVRVEKKSSHSTLNITFQHPRDTGDPLTLKLSRP